MENLLKIISNNLVFTTNIEKNTKVEYANMLRTWSNVITTNFDNSSYPFFSINICQNYEDLDSVYIEDFFLLENNLISLFKSLNKKGILPCFGVYPTINYKFLNDEYIKKTENLIVNVLNSTKAILVVNYESIKKNNNYLEFVRQLSLNNKIVMANSTDSFDSNFFDYLDGFINVSNIDDLDLEGIDETLIYNKIAKVEQLKNIARAITKEDEEEVNEYELTLRNYVLVKNYNNSLPLDKKSKTYILGYDNGIDSAIPYKQGYDLDKGTLKQSYKIVDSCDNIVIIGKIDDDTNRLNKYAEELLTRASQSSKNTILILDFKSNINTSFEEYADAIIFGDTTNINAINDLLDGSFLPCGRLVETYSKTVDSEYFTGDNYGYHFYENMAIKINFPFGLGLSYNKITFDEFSVNDNYISFKIKNESNIDRYYTLELYKGSSFNNKELFYYEMLHLSQDEERIISIDVSSANKEYVYLAEDALTMIHEFVLEKINENTENLNIVSETIIENDDNSNENDIDNEEIYDEFTNEEESSDTFESNDSSFENLNNETFDSSETTFDNINNESIDFNQFNNDQNELDNNKRVKFYNEFNKFSNNVKNETEEKIINEDNVSFNNIPNNEISATSKNLDVNTGPFVSKKTVIILSIILDIILIVIGAIFIVNKNIILGAVLFVLTIIADIIIFVALKLNYKKGNIKSYTDEFETLPSIKPDTIEEETTNNTETEEKVENTLVFDSTNINVSYKEYTYYEIVNSLYQYFLDNGLLIEKEDIYKILSSMFTAKICLIKTKDIDYIEQFICILASFFGALPFGVFMDNYKDYKDFIYNNKNFNNFHTETINHNNVSLCYINYQDTNIVDFFKPWIPYFNYVEDKIRIGEDFDVNLVFTEISKKIWYFINVSDKELSSYSSLLLENATLLDIKIQVNNINEVKEQISLNSINYSYFEILKNTDSDKPFINEEKWEKLDHIIEFINNNKNFTLTNKVIVEIEEYAKVIIGINPDYQDLAFDLALSAILIPLIKNLDLMSETILDIANELENTYGYDAMSHSISELKTL